MEAELTKGGGAPVRNEEWSKHHLQVLLSFVIARSFSEKYDSWMRA